MLWQLTTSDECMVAHWREKTMRCEKRADFEYFGKRAAQERSAAAKSPDQRAQRVHLELAERYSKLAGEVTWHNPLKLRPVS